MYNCSSTAVGQYLKKKRYAEDNGDRKEFLSELENPTGKGIAGPQVQYLKEIIPKIRGINIRHDGAFYELVILVVEKNGALSQVDGYWTDV